MTAVTTSWIKIGRLDEIPVLGARVIKTAAGCVAVFRAAENEVFALEDRCPHKGGPLSQGIVHGRSVTCPLHGMVLSLESGEAMGADSGSVRTFPLKVEDGYILIDAANLSARNAA